MGFFDFFTGKKKEELKESLDKGLEKTKDSFFERLTKAVVGKSEIDDSVLDELEEILIGADVGTPTTIKLIAQIQERVKREKYTSLGELDRILREEVASLLEKGAPDPGLIFRDLPCKPYIIMVVGVNGVGKTTLINAMFGSRDLDIGERWIQPGCILGYLSQSEKMPHDITVLEYLMHALYPAETNTNLSLAGEAQHWGDPAHKSYLVDIVCQNLQINKKDDLIIEPSAGNGAFISNIKSLSNNYKFYDIKPENTEIIKQDFLELNYNDILKKLKKDSRIHLIGNPPFGRQSSFAIKFIKYACNFTNTISFILPKSFKKDSLKKIFPLTFHLIFQVDLPDKSFLVDGIEHDVPCIFQIWEKKTYNRNTIEKLKPLHFIFVDKKNNPDISFRRVGIYAGKIDKNSVDKSVQSHYFIKFTTTQNVDAIVALLSSSIKFNHNNTVGPRSISKPELISEFNKYL